MESTLKPRVVELIAEKAELPVTELELGRTLEDAGLDSLHIMELALTVQKEFGVTIVEGELQLEQTVAEVVSHLEARIG
ncbi:acyl carrier protein [Actinoplanes sp. NPDC051475]|uniref:acyl carrier protein n=1 Tax=Actinoplanes sp. NPDC051475 TaxID=3157225 RepID=UPI00344BC6C7